MGSFDPVWTAGAEGRFLAGAITIPSRHPMMMVGRFLLVIVFVAPGMGPFFGAMHAAHGAFQAPIIAGIGAVALIGVRRVLTRR